MESAEAEAKLFGFLATLGIKTETCRHSAVFTVEAAQAHRRTAGNTMPGGHAKSLYVRDNKKRRALVMIEEDRRVDLKSLAKKIGLKRISFGSSDSLQDMLGVSPGSVTPFALVNAPVPTNDTPGLAIAIDSTLMNRRLLWFHPLHNEATTSITPDDLIKFIEACGYEPIIVDLNLSDQGV